MLILHENQLNTALSEIKNNYVFLHPILLDTNKHVACNKLCAMYCYVLKTHEEYLFIYDHPSKLIDISNVNWNEVKIFTFDKKSLMHILGAHDNIIDINLYLHFINSQIIDVNTYKHNTQRVLEEKHYNAANIRNAISIQILNVWGRNLKDLFLTYDFAQIEGFNFYNDIANEALYNIEKNGIAYTNLNKYFPYKQKYFTNNLIYSNYNLNTATGRPSNCYANINFAALNKENGERSVICSRFGTDGLLVECDFESYHIRLIADLIGYNLPNENAHAYLAKQYFQKDVVTPEEIKEAKLITWQLLYGGIQKEFKVIPFFQQTDDFVRNLWNEKYINKDVYTKIAGKKILGKFENQYKLFNYLLQAHETERNMQLILDISKYLDIYLSRLILYQYDSFLFDIKLTELKDTLPTLIDILNGDKYPVSIKYGLNYHNMQKYKIK